MLAKRPNLAKRQPTPIATDGQQVIVVYQQYPTAAPARRVETVDQQLAAVARWGVGTLLVLTCFWMLGSAIIHQANVNHWIHERQIKQIYGHPIGGQ